MAVEIDHKRMLSYLQELDQRIETKIKALIRENVQMTDLVRQNEQVIQRLKETQESLKTMQWAESDTKMLDQTAATALIEKINARNAEEEMPF